MNKQAPPFLRWLVRHLPVIAVGLASIAFVLIGIADSHDDIGVALIVAGGLGLAGVLVCILLNRVQASLLWFAAVSSGLLLAMGSLQFSYDSSVLLYSIGAVSMIITLCSTVIWLQLSSRQSSVEASDPVLEKLREIHEQTMLSDTARRVLYRERELELLRRTIEEDLRRGDFNAALVLCEDMQKLFGYTEEADAARARVLELRNATQAEQIQLQVTEVHRLLGSGRWRKARYAASRLHRLYPDSPQLEELEQSIDVVIEDRKRALQVEFNTAVSAGDTEQSMIALRELDRYLDPQEAEAMRASAQEVIAGHRELLSQGFREAVSRHDWKEAVRCGERITMEYPMDTMATEVREMMGRLRERANAIESSEELPAAADTGQVAPGQGPRA